MTLSEIVEQLRMCGYVCEAGPLELNVAFIELVRMAEGDAWGVLGKLAGTVDAPKDWATQHDYYLYGTPKRTPPTD